MPTIPFHFTINDFEQTFVDGQDKQTTNQPAPNRPPQTQNDVSSRPQKRCATKWSTDTSVPASVSTDEPSLQIVGAREQGKATGNRHAPVAARSRPPIYTMADLLWRRKAATTHDGGRRSSAGTTRAGGGGGLAKLWEVVVGLGGRRGPRWRRRSRVRVGAMELWQKMVFPMKRVWTVVATRVRSRKNGRLLLPFYLSFVCLCGV